MIAEKLIYKGDRLERQNVVWNTAGSFCYALASMVLAFLVMRIAGDEEGGIFSFGFSTLGQQLFIVAYFGIRPFQITDLKEEFSFGDYLNHRRLTSALAVAAGVLYLLFQQLTGRYSPYKAAVLLLLVLYKVIDGYADVYESEFQRQGSLYLTGKSNFFRTILSVLVFLAALLLTGSLLTACGAAVAAQLIGLWIFDLQVLPLLDRVVWERGAGQGRRLSQACMLLFVSVFLDFYVFSSSKYAIDSYLNDAASGYFNLIFMPTSVIYMVANFIIRPFLTKLTRLWEARDLTEFARQLRWLGGVIAGLTVLAVGATALIGPLVLQLMELLLGADYKDTLTVYHLAFTLIVLGGGFYALANLMYYALVIMRKQRWIFLVYLAAAAAAFFLSAAMVVRYEILGAAVCYLLLMLGITGGFGVCVLNTFRRQKGECEENAG